MSAFRANNSMSRSRVVGTHSNVTSLHSSAPHFTCWLGPRGGFGLGRRADSKLPNVPRRAVSVDAGDLRKGDIIEHKGKRCVIIKTQQNITNRKAFLIVDMRDIVSGLKHNANFRAAEKVERLFIQTVKMKYLFSEGQTAYLQNPETFDQAEVSTSLMGNLIHYIGEGDDVELMCSDEGDVLSVILPSRVTCEVASTDGSTRSMTASPQYKTATLVNGRDIQVPIFVDVGEKVVINLEDESYVERA